MRFRFKSTSLEITLVFIAVACTLQGLCLRADESALTPFEGLKALVIEPENFWGWDASIFGALQERQFDVTYAKPEILEDFNLLSQYDLVASNIRRTFTTQQKENLKKFIWEGGAFYGSWGGPMFERDFLQDVCCVAGTKSVWITGMRLLDDTPLVKGLTERDLRFPPLIGHAASERWEMVAVMPAERGIPVAKDDSGNVLGVLACYGKGRIAVLGFGPEREKYFDKREVALVVLDNLLSWLLEERMKQDRKWTGVLEIALPARAEVTGIFLNGKRLAVDVQEFGSIKKVKVNVQSVGDGKEATIRLTYKPLSRARNVETLIHLPWGSFPRGGPPVKLAEWLKSINATMCQPLLREASGHAYYRGMPEDIPDPISVAQYQGNFLADFIEECHKRGIKVIGGIYFEHRTTLAKYPEASVVRRDGTVVKNQACFNNPKGQEYNLATIQHLLDNYNLDGIILDDNFELQHYDCHCQFCKEDFKAYCARKGIPYEDPSLITGGLMRRYWRECKLEATRKLAQRVAEIAHRHSVPAGGWIGPSMESAGLAQVFDFLGGMIYTSPPRAARLMLSSLGKCKFITLLWAPGELPERIEREAIDAVHAGSVIVGFWVYPPGHSGAGAFRMLEGSYDAIARAFAKVEEEWLRFHRNNILRGDPRFIVLGGKVGSMEAILRIKNLGKKAHRRIEGTIDIDAKTIAPAVKP